MGEKYFYRCKTGIGKELQDGISKVSKALYNPEMEYSKINEMLPQFMLVGIMRQLLSGIHYANYHNKIEWIDNKNPKEYANKERTRTPNFKHMLETSFEPLFKKFYKIHKNVFDDLCRYWFRRFTIEVIMKEDNYEYEFLLEHIKFSISFLSNSLNHLYYNKEGFLIKPEFINGAVNKGIIESGQMQVDNISLATNTLLFLYDMAEGYKKEGDI